MDCHTDQGSHRGKSSRRRRLAAATGTQAEAAQLRDVIPLSSKSLRAAKAAQGLAGTGQDSARLECPGRRETRRLSNSSTYHLL